MKPQQNDFNMFLPLTFDIASKQKTITSKNKKLYSLATVGVWLLANIVAGVIFKHFLISFTVLTIIAVSFVRFYVYRELYYKKVCKDIQDNGNSFDYTVFWKVFSVNDVKPCTLKLQGGLKAVAILFDKDIVVGKDMSSDYEHYEAVTEAYHQIAMRGIEFMHIDYMSDLGVDTRLDGVFKNLAYVKNNVLRECLFKIMDNIQLRMTKAYTSYDVYVFYYRGRDDLFWEELRVIVNYFLKANYIRARLLDKAYLSVVVKALFGVAAFSVNDACASLVGLVEAKEYLKTLWVAEDGVKTVINKSSKELIAEREASELEKNIKRSKKKWWKRKKLKDDIDLFN